MLKFNEELLQYYVNKHLGYMTQDAQNLVEVTERGFEYKGELIVAIDNLKSKLIVKAPAKAEVVTPVLKKDEVVEPVVAPVTPVEEPVVEPVAEEPAAKPVEAPKPVSRKNRKR